MRACEQEYTPLPLDGPLDLIFAYSVFTHIGPETQRAVLRVMREMIAPRGLLAITIRPPAYWETCRLRKKMDTDERRAVLVAEHEARGLAFNPHQGPDALRIDYGDVSMSLAHIKREWRGWSVEHVNWRADDEMQVRVFLRPR